MKMKQLCWLIFGLSFALTPVVRGEEMNEKAEKKNEATVDKKTEATKAEEAKVDYDKLSVALGHYFVRNLTKTQSPLKVDKIIEGMKAEQKKKEPPMTQEEFQQGMISLQVEQYQATSEKNLKDATAFLEKNAKEKDVVTINPKLQYKIVKQGEGTETLTEDSKPLVRVEGKLLDGTVFSANKEGEAISLSLKDTVPGIRMGMVGMKKGEKRTLYIHPELAFGANCPLPPNSLIIFDVEVVDMKSPETPKADEAAPAVKEETKPAASQEPAKKEASSVTAQTEAVNGQTAPVVSAVTTAAETKKAVDNKEPAKTETATPEGAKAEKATTAHVDGKKDGKKGFFQKKTPASKK